MSIMTDDRRKLDNIAKMYHTTSGEIQEMWKKKWYELVKIVSKKIQREEELEEIADRNGF